MCNPNLSQSSSTIKNNNLAPSISYINLVTFNKNFHEIETNNINNNDGCDFISNSSSKESLSSSSSSSSLAFPSIYDVIKETWSLFILAFPILLTNLILYSRSVLSMVYLGRVGDAELAAGSLAIAFANITGYSVFSGLALGMEPLCSQAFGAHRPKLLSLTLQRCVIFLLVCCVPISLLWYHMSHILGYLHQDPKIANLAHTYIMFTFPDLIFNAFYHPIKIYLRAQGITRPVTAASVVGAVLHLPIMALLVGPLHMGIVGVAVTATTSNLASLAALVMQIWIGGLHVETWSPPSRECLTGWGPLIKLAVPSCVTVCLEWWWYEIMIVLCGLLANPQTTVASMGVLMQTTGLIYNFPAALSNAVSTRVGNELGAGRVQWAKLSGMLGIIWGTLLGLTAMTFSFWARNIWATLFTQDGQILALTAAALPILGLCELGNCPQTVAAGVVRGTARPSTAAKVVLGAFYVAGMPMAVGLGFYAKFGFTGLWIGLLSAQICCAGLLLYVVGSTDWDDQAKRAQLLTHTSSVDSSVILHDHHHHDDQKIGQCDDENKKPLVNIIVTSS